MVKEKVQMMIMMAKMYHVNSLKGLMKLVHEYAACHSNKGTFVKYLR
jgi:hypothetical protein